MPTTLWSSSGARSGLASRRRIRPLNTSRLISQWTPVSEFIANTPMYVAHRGGSNDWPEETMQAYDNAAAWNSSLALEISVWQSSDGVYVCSHDQTTGRVFSGTSLDIPTNTWATLSTKTTIIGSQPIVRLDTVLASYGGNRVIFIDNKGSQNNATLLNLIDSYGGPAWFICKQYETGSSWPIAARARGYTTWGYYYEADVPDLPTTAARWDLLGMDITASGTAWTTILGYGKPVIGHTPATAADATTAYSKGATGIMAAGVMEAIPSTIAAGGGGTWSSVGPIYFPLDSGSVKKNSNTSGTAMSVAKPDTLADNDILVAIMYDQVAGSSITAPGAEWTPQFHATQPSTRGFYIFTKPILSAAAEAGVSAYQFNSSNSGRWCGIICRMVGALQTPLDAVPSLDVYNSAGGLTIVDPSVDAVNPGAVMLACNFANGVSNAVFTASASGFTTIANVNVNNAGSTSTLDVAYAPVNQAGATGAVTTTLSGSAASSGGFLITFAPALGFMGWGLSI